MTSQFKRLLLLGDVHGETGQIAYALARAQEFDCQAIFQLGDFGYWAHQQHGVNFLRKVDRMCKTIGIPLYWLDGNHENHTLLRELYAPGGPNHILNPEGFWQMSDAIFYSPRAHRWEWNGVKFLSCGGAYSIDMKWRLDREEHTRHKSMHTLWWPEEMITDNEVAASIEDGKTDVLLTHDAPRGIDLALHFHLNNVEWLKGDPASERNRDRVRQLVDATHPTYLFHGHLHIWYRDILQLEDGWEVEVEGLDRDGKKKRSFTVLDLEVLSDELSRRSGDSYKYPQ